MKPVIELHCLMTIRRLSFLLAVAATAHAAAAIAQTAPAWDRWEIYSRYHGPTDLRFAVWRVVKAGRVFDPADLMDDPSD